MKLATKLPRDPKWKSLSAPAKAAYIEIACEIGEQETDGLFHTTGQPNRAQRELIDKGLAESHPGGLYLPAFLKWNPSKADLERKREAGAKRVARSRNAVTPPVTNGVGNAEHSSTEVEVEVEEHSSNPLGSRSGALAPLPPNQAMFAAICEAFGIDWQAITKSARGVVNAQEQQLREAGMQPGELAQYVEWLRTSPESPLVGGRRLTIGSLAKWLPYWKSRALMVNERTTGKARNVSNILALADKLEEGK